MWTVSDPAPRHPGGKAAALVVLVTLAVLALAVISTFNH
jgi:hypothetical protein